MRLLMTLFLLDILSIYIDYQLIGSVCMCGHIMVSHQMFLGLLVFCFVTIAFLIYFTWKAIRRWTQTDRNARMWMRCGAWAVFVLQICVIVKIIIVMNLAMTQGFLFVN